MLTIEQSWEDGYRCGRKGLGLTRSNRFDYNAQDRLFGRIQFSIRPNDREEAAEAWGDGWFEGIHDRPVPNSNAPLTIRELG